MKCPHDQTEMDRLTRHGVTIDHCPTCGGVWLDKGEIETMLEAVRPAVALPDPEPAPPPRPARKPQPKARAEAPSRRTGQRYGGRYSRKSPLAKVLEEIFDFDFD